MIEFFIYLSLKCIFRQRFYAVGSIKDETVELVTHVKFVEEEVVEFLVDILKGCWGDILLFESFCFVLMLGSIIMDPKRVSPFAVLIKLIKGWSTVKEIGGRGSSSTLIIPRSSSAKTKNILRKFCNYFIVR